MEYERLITVRCDNNVTYAKYTLPYIEAYAKRCRAEVLYLNTDFDTEYGRPGKGKYCYRIMNLYSILENSLEVLNLDADILIMPNCPDIFEMSENKIAGVFEDVGNRSIARQNLISELKQNFGDIDWNSGFLNMGVALFPQKARDIFKGEKVWNGSTYDSAYISYQIAKKKYPVKSLSYRYNHMPMFTESFGFNRYDSYIIHYAGKGVFDAGGKDEQIRKDVDYVYKS